MTTTAVAGSPLGLADGEDDAVLPLLPLWLFFLLDLELEQPPPLLLLLLLFPLPPVDENPVSAKTTATSTAVNLIRRPATMTDHSPSDERRVTLPAPSPTRTPSPPDPVFLRTTPWVAPANTPRHRFLPTTRGVSANFPPA
ncbi:hypothetical protein [Streptomyces sp. CB00455]|uniref:hypothetical protein n=1 Tax=Streptomyces sp. CB00455 TaxID=1703927 RepID=UPI001161013A|nr:hypothetical protein [Streptomyces sp. CB00455]